MGAKAKVRKILFKELKMQVQRLGDGCGLQTNTSTTCITEGLLWDFTLVYCAEMDKCHPLTLGASDERRPQPQL